MESFCCIYTSQVVRSDKQFEAIEYRFEKVDYADAVTNCNVVHKGKCQWDIVTVSGDV